MNKQIRSKQSGMGLIEVLIAIVILAIGVLALGRFQGVAMQDVSSSRNRSQAMELAQAKLESLRNFSNLVAYNTIADGADAGPITGENTSYSRTWDVTEFSSPPYKEVTINVAWEDVSGAAQAVKLSSLIGYRDPVQSGIDLDSFGGGDDEDQDKGDGKDDDEGGKTGDDQTGDDDKTGDDETGNNDDKEDDTEDNKVTCDQPGDDKEDGDKEDGDKEDGDKEDGDQEGDEQEDGDKEDDDEEGGDKEDDDKEDSDKGDEDKEGGDKDSCAEVGGDQDDKKDD